MNIKWDGEKYTKSFAFVHRYGNSLIDMIDGEKLSVLDLGCGNGALTKELCNKGYDAVGMDASSELLDIARRNYPELTFIYGDAVSFETDKKYDVVFSNAVFHWIDKEKQPYMLSNVYKALKSGGQFIFEMGGYGNNVLIHGALKNEFEKNGKSYVMPFYFPTIGEYAALLENAGFLVRNAVLFDRMTELEGENGLHDWIRMFVKKPFEGIAGDMEESIINSAVAVLKNKLCKNGKWYSDYVRLRCKAVKP